MILEGQADPSNQRDPPLQLFDGHSNIFDDRIWFFDGPLERSFWIKEWQNHWQSMALRNALDSPKGAEIRQMRKSASSCEIKLVYVVKQLVYKNHESHSPDEHLRLATTQHKHSQAQPRKQKKEAATPLHCPQQNHD